MPRSSEEKIAKRLKEIKEKLDAIYPQGHQNGHDHPWEETVDIPN
jgi:hypothetical protein